MAAKTPKQRQQRDLAWKLRVVKGAIGTLYPREADICTRLYANTLRRVCSDLEDVARLIKHDLGNIK